MDEINDNLASLDPYTIVPNEIEKPIRNLIPIKVKTVSTEIQTFDIDGKIITIPSELLDKAEKYVLPDLDYYIHSLVHLYDDYVFADDEVISLEVQARIKEDLLLYHD